MNKLITLVLSAVFLFAGLSVASTPSASAAGLAPVTVTDATRQGGIIATFLGRMIPALRGPQPKPLPRPAQKPGETSAQYKQRIAEWERRNTPRGDKWREPHGWDGMA